MLYVTFFAAVLAGAAVCACGALVVGIDSFLQRLTTAIAAPSRVWVFASRWPLPTVLLLAVCTAALTPTFRDWLLSAVSFDGTGLAGSEARKLMYLHYLPENAEDVNCSVRFNMALADFSISQSDFVQWCKKRDCQAQRIGEPPYEDAVRVRHGSLDGQHELLIRRGLVCEIESQQHLSIRIVFDSERSRAYYQLRAW